ncbi:MAG: hypothetical protein DWQ42_00975 [Planctomycetota bacterium]|nr:MAG: hypothetical protein DWQ42_00975 [Planctomycetota bacterium]REK43580.1 MAG: hypothetical protein DWQ46_10860 [Planctomycetota bacterium]
MAVELVREIPNFARFSWTARRVPFGSSRPRREGPVSNPQSEQLLRQLEAGQSEAAAAVFDRYVGRLVELIRSRMGASLRRRIDAEDVVQSAYRSFFRRAGDGDFRTSQQDDLWRLLARIALHKLYGQIEKHTAQKRNIARDRPLDETLERARAEPPVVEAIALAEELRLVLEDLSDEERGVLEATLRGEPLDEIARVLGRSERTVRRLLGQCRRRMEDRFECGPTAPRDLRPLVDEAAAPLKFADYVLERLIGAGGMGKVFRAREEPTGRIVAVKALHKARQGDARAVTRFVQESQILSQLHHGHLVRVEGLGRFPSGGLFMVMEYIEGSDLQRRLELGPFPLAEVVRLGSEVAEAVRHAHRHGVVHCDLKPANVLLDVHERAHVTDFGFAWMTSRAVTADRSLIGGTIGYMAPELLASNTTPTPAVDVYAVGRLVAAMATGRSDGEWQPDVDDDPRLQPLRELLDGCLAVDPRQRLATIDRVLECFAALR